MDIELAAQAVGELAHLAPLGAGIALCGLTGMKLAKKFFYLGQVGCKDCQHEHARRKRRKHERR